MGRLNRRRWTQRHAGPGITGRVGLRQVRRRRQVRRDVPHRQVHVGLLLADRRDVMQGRARRRFTFEASDDPGGQVGRGHATAGRGHVACGKKRLVQYLDAGFLHPGPGREIGTCRHGAEQAEFREHQGAGTLGGDELAGGIEPQRSHQRRVRDNLAGLDAAAHDDGIGRGGLLQARLRMHDDPVHRRDRRLRTTQADPPVRLLDAVENAQRDQRVQLVEALEGQDGDMHGTIVPRNAALPGTGARSARAGTSAR